MKMTNVSVKIIRTLIFLATVLCTSYSCHDEGAEPVPNSLIGKRYFTWQIDTLLYPGSFQILMFGLWGSSTHDVYAVGHNNTLGPGSAFHYNGSKWQEIKLSWTEGGPIQNGFDLFGLYGFNSNDIYAVGDNISYNDSDHKFTDSSLIIHFNGQQWNVVDIPKHEMLTCVSGSAPNDVWAGGSRGSIYHYNGVTWSYTLLSEELYVTSIASLSQNNVYLEAHRESQLNLPDSSTYLLYRYDGGTWWLVDSVNNPSNSASKRFGMIVWTDGSRLYSLSPNITLWEKNEWIRLLNATVGGMVRGNDKSYFAFGNGVYNYNGIDWLKYSQFDTLNSNWRSGYTDGNEIFIVGNVGQSSIILHGK